MEGVTYRLLFTIIAATFGSAFQHGYNTGVVNVPQKVIEQFINSTYHNEASSSQLEFQYSLMVSVFCLGGMIGPMFTPLLSENFGRKGALLLNCIFVFVAALLMALARRARTYSLLIVGRFIIGLNAGLSSSLVPMYLSEICPISLRGAGATVYQLILVTCILVAQILGLPHVLGTDQLWPTLFGIIIFPTLFMLCTLPFCPESPKFLLIMREDPELATAALQWLRCTDDVSNEIRNMRIEHGIIKQMPKMKFSDFRKDPVLNKSLTMAIVVMLAQQFSGINAIMLYSTRALTANSEASHEHAVYTTLAMGVVNLVMTIVSMALVDKTGRRTLLFVGMGGTIVINILMNTSLPLSDQFKWMSYISMAGIVAFVIFFAAGLGSIPWFLAAELFEQNSRPMAMSIAASVNWFSNFVISVGFLPRTNLIGPHVFVIFAISVALCLAYTYFNIPETKNRPLQEITNEIKEKIYGKL